MAMEPLPSQWINPPPTIAPVQSAFSPGGAYYPTPQNNYNIAPTSYNSFANPYAQAQSPYTSQQQQASNSGFGGIVDNISNVKTVGQFAGNGFSLPQSSMLNNFGAGLGFAPGSVSYGTAFGPTALGSSAEAFGPLAADAGSLVSGSSSAVGGTTLSSTLGAAGIGALAGNFLGRIGGNATGGSIGGGIGAGIGMAVGGPVGGVIGGLIGGIGGGFFGGKKPGTNADNFGAQMNGVGDIDAFGYASKNPGPYEGFAKTLSRDIADATKAAKSYFPEKKDWAWQAIQGGISTQHGGAGIVIFPSLDISNGGGKTINFNGDDPNDRKRAVTEAVAQLLRGSGIPEEQVNQTIQRIQSQGQIPGSVNTNRNMPFVPVKDNQRFADYMNKTKTQAQA